MLIEIPYMAGILSVFNIFYIKYVKCIFTIVQTISEFIAEFIRDKLFNSSA